MTIYIAQGTTYGPWNILGASGQPNFITPWKAATGLGDPPRFRTEGSNVRLEGWVTPTSGQVYSHSLLFTLPQNYCPATYQRKCVWGAGPSGEGYVFLDISSATGEVTIESWNTAAMGQGVTIVSLACTFPLPATPPTYATPLSTLPPPNIFIIGVFAMVSTLHATWKARGINTMVQYERGGETFLTWRNSLAAQGLYGMWQQSDSGRTIAQDVADTQFLAFCTPDEPDLSSSNSPASIDTLRRTLRAAAPTAPVAINLAGGVVNRLQGPFSGPEADYALQGGDWIGADFYPIGGWNTPSWLDLSLATPNDTLGDVVREANLLSGGKPYMATIECSAQNLTQFSPNYPPAPTDVQVRGEMWHCIIQGATAICFFSYQFNPGFVFDATPSTVATMITNHTAIITAHQQALLGTRTPNASLALPFEGASWNDGLGHTVTVVLNMSPNTEILSGVSYAPFQISVNGTLVT